MFVVSLCWIKCRACCSLLGDIRTQDFDFLGCCDDTRFVHFNSGHWSDLDMIGENCLKSRPLRTSGSEYSLLKGVAMCPFKTDAL